ncbi:hypothetical protein AOLI_G00231350 [Acnodon oligacanthus]
MTLFAMESESGQCVCVCCFRAIDPPPPSHSETGTNSELGIGLFCGISDFHCFMSSASEQLPHRRVTFSTTNPVQDLQDSSQQSYYDSGLEESETPSSKSSSGPRIGPLALPEDHYERTTPDGSIGEMEHPENAPSPFPSISAAKLNYFSVVFLGRTSPVFGVLAAKTRLFRITP